MSEQLTIRELAPYLPYGLFIMCGSPKPERLKMYRISCHSNILDKDVFTVTTVKGEWNSLWIKPLLRPLSQLTETIEHNGETFTPFGKIAIYPASKNGIAYLIDQIQTGQVEVIVWQMLIEWHFDVFGLIPRNLALPIKK